MNTDHFVYRYITSGMFPLEDRRGITHLETGHTVVIGRDLDQRWCPQVVKSHTCDTDETANEIMAAFFVALGETADHYIAGTPGKIRVKQL